MRPRVLALVAHPDDETLGAGGALAWWARRGEVLLVTATRGERGEVIGAAAAELSSNRQALARHRQVELDVAVSALGIGRHLFLDELPGLDHRYVDSGMEWADQTHTRAVAAPDAGPAAFAHADINEVGQALAAAIDQFQPHLVLTEEPGGGYGHPDHVQAHRVATRAVELAQTRPLLAWFARAENQERAALRWLRQARGLPTSTESGAPLQFRDPDGPLPTMVTTAVDISLDVRAEIPRVVAAMRAHATQVQLVHHDSEAADAAGWYALSDGVLSPIPVWAGLRAAPGSAPVQLRFLVAQADRLAQPPLPEREPRWYQPVAMVCVVLLALMLAAAGTAFHRANPPMGVVVALGAVTAGSVLVRTFLGGRGVLIFALSVTAVAFSMTYLRPGQDLLVTNESVSLVWLLGAIIAAGAAAAMPAAWLRDHPGHDEPADAGSAPPEFLSDPRGR
ncbi:MAG: PIG-L family deacetylase [Beutenbergiaceae bacterium]